MPVVVMSEKERFLHFLNGFKDGVGIAFDGRLVVSCGW